MAVINKVDAFIKAAEIFSSEEYSKEAAVVAKIITRALEEDKKNNTYSTHIRLSREEKKAFNVSFTY
ncbi:hypothetical protein [Phosphitispora sp. TUW77]|uniref:hypothetical protein n=1 Tax=Phosphitispora sp. TUW77 TaxID=3152361 RepID=UPI003AB5A3E7